MVPGTNGLHHRCDRTSPRNVSPASRNWSRQAGFASADTLSMCSPWMALVTAIST